MAEVSDAPAGQNKHDEHHEVRERLETAIGAAKEVGLPLEHFERVLFWWKHLGLRSALSFLVVAVLPVLNAECRAKAGEHVVNAFAQYHEIDLEVADWSGQFFGGQAIAHRVTLKGRGPFARAELFTADQITVDLSAWRWVKYNAFRLPWHWQLGDVLKGVEIDKPQIYAERTLSGQWNWDEVLALDDDSEKESPALPVGLPHLDLKNLRVQWVEQMPAASGSGVLQASTFTIYLEDVDARIDNINIERNGAMLPVGFAIDGRTADGRFSLKGKAQYDATSPRLTATVVLQNIGAAAFGRMLVRSALVPSAGTIDGRIELDAKYPALSCRANVSLRNVSYALNPTAPLTQTSRPQIERELASLQLNRGVFANCDGDISNPEFRLLPAVQAAMTAQALSDAPPVVRQVAANDYRHFGDQLASSALNAAAAAASQKAGDLVNHMFGVPPAAAPGMQNGVAPAQPAQRNQSGKSPLKSFMKLFGGGKKKH